MLTVYKRMHCHLCPLPVSLVSLSFSFHSPPSFVRKKKSFYQGKKIHRNRNTQTLEHYHDTTGTRVWVTLWWMTAGRIVGTWASVWCDGWNWNRIEYHTKEKAQMCFSILFIVSMCICVHLKCIYTCEYRLHLCERQILNVNTFEYLKSLCSLYVRLELCVCVINCKGLCVYVFIMCECDSDCVK